MAKKYKLAKVNIKKMLKCKDVTQYRLAKLMGVTTEYTTRLVQNENPTVKTLNKVAKALECKVSELIDE